MLVVSTASPYKFANDVLLSVTGSGIDNDLLAPKALLSASKVEIPSPLKKILTQEAKHTDICDKEDMANEVFKFVLAD
jgi:threonine synthase